MYEVNNFFFIIFLQAGKSVILVFSIQGSGHFQGYARLAGENPVTGEIPLDLSGNHSLSAPLPVDWIKRGNIPYHATRHLFNPYNDYAKVQTSRDGQVSSHTLLYPLIYLLK